MLWSQRLKIIKAPGKDFGENLKGQTEIIRNNKKWYKALIPGFAA